MTADKIVYIEQKIRVSRSGSYTSQHGGADENVIAHYGPMSERGEDKWIALEKLIRRLRKMAAAGALAKDIAVPERFKQFEKFTIPAAILAQDKAAPIDRDALAKANPAK